MYINTKFMIFTVGKKLIYYCTNSNTSNWVE